MSEINREQIARYFKPFPKWTTPFLLIGMALLVIPMGIKGVSWIVPVIGLGLLGIGGLGIYLFFTGRPSDMEMDDWFREELRIVNIEALRKLGMDASDAVAEPVSVWGPRIENTAGISLQVAVGKDGNLRYNPVDLNILNFGQNQLCSYQCAYDRFTGKRLQETTDEYFYKDVVSVSTKTDTTLRHINVVGKKGTEPVVLKESEMFRLTTSGGTSVEVFIQDQALLKLNSTRGGQLPTSQAENAVMTVRRMLRDKKGT